MNKNQIIPASAWINTFTGLDLSLWSIPVLWAIVFILASGVLPEELVWIAKWEHSGPLNGTRCCFDTLFCSVSVAASQKSFLGQHRCPAGVSESLWSPNANCPLPMIWKFFTKIHISTCVPHVSVLAQLLPPPSESIQIFIIVARGPFSGEKKKKFWKNKGTKWVNNGKSKVRNDLLLRAVYVCVWH